MNLTNPYKLQQQPMKELRFDVSEAAHARVYAICPRRGWMDGILSNLFYRFVQEIESTIPLPTEVSNFSTNEEQVALILSRISFKSPL